MLKARSMDFFLSFKDQSGAPKSCEIVLESKPAIGEMIQVEKMGLRIIDIIYLTRDGGSCWLIAVIEREFDLFVNERGELI